MEWRGKERIRGKGEKDNKKEWERKEEKGKVDYPACEGKR